MDIGLLEKSSRHLSGNDRSFFMRVWRTPQDVYVERLRAIGFMELGRVLDAGSGFGQWLLALARLNREVVGVELQEDRLRTCEDILEFLRIDNVSVERQSLEETSFPEAYFDGVFCYSALYLTDVDIALKEFRRVLRPGGKLYVCANGCGWYIHNILRKQHDDSFNVRKYGSDAILNTLRLFFGVRAVGKPVVLPSRVIRRKLKDLGFNNVRTAGEGKLRLVADTRPNSFFRERYYGMEGVYEILATR